MRIAATAILVLIAGSTSAQSSSDVLVTDADGVHITRTNSQIDSANAKHPGFQEDLLWTFTDPISVPFSTALGNLGTETWVGHALNDKRLGKFSTQGSNVPDFTYSLSAENPSSIGVAAASQASLCAMITQSATAQIAVRAFTDANGATPIWTYNFDAQYIAARDRSVAVSADGSRIAALAYNGTDTQLVILDGSGNVLGSTTVPGFSLRIDMDDSGNRVVVTAGATATLYDTATLNIEYVLGVSGAGGYSRISRDGTAIAAGGFNVRAAREIEGVWQTVYTGTGSTDWFGAVSLSADGETLFAVSHDYGSGYLINDHRSVDLTTGAVVATSGYTGSGANQNSVVSSEVNSNGTLFVAASWGDSGNTMPEIRVYDRDLNLVDSLDTAGSPFSLDLSPDGSYILVGSKSVHANTNGNGGNTQVYQLASDCLADTNGDGQLTPTDFTAWINAFNNNLPECDQNNDNACTPTDFTAWIANFNAGC
ncbi:MAG: hypothetical protein COB69_07790 [Phycisphaera sp.]|nr:MAG: hypothetical protein COB69_07790 [Phycisphaera sp.]